MSSLDVLISHLTAPATVPAPIRVGLRRGVVRGLSVRDLVDIAGRHPAARETVWAVFGLSPPAEVDETAGVRAIFDVLGTAVGSRSPLTIFRLTRLPRRDFDSLLDTVRRLTVPDDVDELFEPTDDDRKRRRDEEVGGAWHDPAVVLSKLALRMQAAGFDDPMSWTPGRLLFATTVLGEHDAEVARGALVNAAVAARLGGADEKGWKRGLAEITGGAA